MAELHDVNCDNDVCRHRLALRWRLRGHVLVLEIVCADKRCRRFYTEKIDIRSLLDGTMSSQDDKPYAARSGYQNADTDEESATDVERPYGHPASRWNRSRRWGAS